MARVVIQVHEIEGTCPVFEMGDKIVVDDAEVVLEETDAYCVWAATSFTPYLLPVRKGIPAKDIGLSHEDKPYFLQCLDPGPPLTPGGTVTFKMSKEE